MKASALNGRNVVIWGTGREGMAAGDYVRKAAPDAKITYVDEATGGDISTVLKSADMIIKSPGVSLYHPLLRGRPVTSLMNLWFAEDRPGITICITGTKGKSTTSSLLGHVLTALGRKACVAGNIGVPVSETPEGMDVYVVETSSFQAANFDGHCDIAAVTSLYAEHLDWHGDTPTYHRDKLHLLGQADRRLVNAQVKESGALLPKDCMVVDAYAGDIPNDYLSRPHNRINVGLVLAIVALLKLDRDKALAAMADFEALAHRQQELGIRDGILYVNDSIATTPYATIAALEFYRDRPVTLIVGGYDRGVDYAPLIAYIKANAIPGIVALGPAGARILKETDGHPVADMPAAIAKARELTPEGGVILLSPAAPSFGLFRNYAERGEAFARESGF